MDEKSFKEYLQEMTQLLNTNNELLTKLISLFEGTFIEGTLLEAQSDNIIDMSDADVAYYSYNNVSGHPWRDAIDTQEH